MIKEDEVKRDVLETLEKKYYFHLLHSLQTREVYITFSDTIELEPWNIYIRQANGMLTILLVSTDG